MSWYTPKGKRHGIYRIRPTGVGFLPRGAEYRVKDLGSTMQGYTELVKKELGVSLDATLGSTRFVQLHELSHVRESIYSPTKMRRFAKTEHVHVLAAEDVRVNALLLRRVPDAHEGYEHPEGKPLRNDLGGYMASWDCPPEVRRLIREGCLDYGFTAAQLDRIDRECKRVTAGKLTIAHVTIPLARLLRDMEKEQAIARLLRESQKQQQQSGEDESESDGESEDESDGGSEDESDEDSSESDSTGDETSNEDEPSDDDFLKEDQEESGQCAQDPHGTPGHGKGYEPNGTGIAWVIPVVTTPALTKSVARPGTHEHRSADSGVALGKLPRLWTDGRIFTRKRAKPGTIKRGTLLIDGSTSLSIPIEDVRRIAEMMPYATIAIYGGNGAQAELRVIAKDGRTVADLDDWRSYSQYGAHSANSCDGPALLWLSRQAGPRVWYSDGCVNGDTAAGYSRVDMRAHVDAILAAAHIVHVMGDETTTAVRETVDPMYSTTLIQTGTRLQDETHADYLLRAVRCIQNGGRVDKWSRPIESLI